RITAAASGDEALRALAARRPDLLITDIEMPDGSGYELIARVRSLSRDHGGEVPAIALTAYAGPEHARRAMENGFQAHLAKPFEAADLLATIRDLVEESSAEP